MSNVLRSFSYVVAISLLVGALASVALAQTFSSDVEMAGWAWSDTIGWISFNCSNDSSCATSDYKVSIETDYDLVGTAWSSNVGWIQFGGLSGFPSGGGNASANAGTGELEGWARVCAAAMSSSTCSGAAATNAGGWDGWISLNCLNDGCANSYAVEIGTSGDFVNSATSYAWGGGTTIGWVDFSYGTFGTPCSVTTQCSAGNLEVEALDQWCGTTVVEVCNTASGYYCVDDGSPACEQTTIPGDLTVDTPFARAGDTVELDWTIDPLAASACTVTDSDGATIGTGLNGPATSNAIARQSTIFTLTCTAISPVANVVVDTVEVTQVSTVIES